MTPQDDDYLAERLREAKDTVSFSHRQPGGHVPAPGTVPEGQVVERVTELTGEAHLGGRKVRDRFIRTSGQAPAPGPAQPAKAPKLDPYLEARLKEVQDQAPRFRASPGREATGPGGAPDVAADAVDTYRELRRKLGGG
jgi:hypothetical protein